MEHRRLGARSLAVILVLCWFVCAVEGNYTLAIWVQGYQNPSHQALELQTFRHGCCERDAALPCDPCDNAFKFCVREGTTGMVLGGCDLAELQTALIADDDDDLMFSLGDDIGGITNPLMVTGDVWPGMIEILFTVYDLDGTVNIDHSSSDVVDNLLISPDISAVADDSFSDSMSYSGNFSHVQLAFRLTCGPAHYGADCSVYCEEVNDTTGHFTCDPATGDRLCLEGYSDPLTNCTQCSQTAIGCSVLGGYCTEPGQCLCREGFSGENCSDAEHPCLLQPCLNGAVCMNSTEDTRNYTCQCLAGFKGLNCNETDPCSPNPCKNDGMCMDTAETSPNHTCVCASGFKGHDCGETKTDACTPNPCVNGTCLEMGEVFVCECEAGYTGRKCEEEVADAGGSDDGGGGVSLLVIVVAAIGGVLALLISAVFIAICVLLCRGRKMKTIEGEEQPNPYEAPSHYLSKWRGRGGHASNGLAERKFDNPLYQEGSLSPVSPPLPPRPEHPYATLEDVHPVALIPTSEGSLNYFPLALVPTEGSLDEKPPQSENTGNSYVDPESGNAPYDQIDPQPTVGSLDCRQDKAPENPYLEPVNPMNSSTVVYAHIQ